MIQVVTPHFMTGCTWLILNTCANPPRVRPSNLLNILTTFSMTGGMITTLMWHDTTNMLAAIQDGSFTVWYYPNAVYIDTDLLPQSKVHKDAG